MGIRKLPQQFYFDFCHRKGQIHWHYDDKRKFVISDSVSTMQWCIINNISKNKFVAV